MSKSKVSFLLILVTAMLSGALAASVRTPSIQVHTVLIENGTFAEMKRLRGTIGYLEEQFCVVPFAGKVTQVCVEAGQKVQKGELIFRLDSSELEKELVTLCKQEEKLKGALRTDNISTLAVSSMQNADLQQLRKSLLAQLEGTQLRSDLEGTVEEIFVREGENVQVATVAGRIRGERKQIAVVDQQGLRMEKSTPALVSCDGEQLGIAYFAGSEVMSGNVLPGRQLSFLFDEERLNQLEEGQTVELTLLDGGDFPAALIPLAAISTDNRVWIVEDDCARSVEIDISKRNESFVAAGDEWSGKRVILLPDLYALSEGCVIEEKKP